MGPRHMPLNAAFMNGTVEGEDIFIPMSMILGGQERCGFGWNMFVECLAEGRGKYQCPQTHYSFLIYVSFLIKSVDAY